MQHTYPPAIVSSEIRVAQINAKGSKMVLLELRKIAEERQIDVMCIQEPYTFRGRIPYMPTSAQIITCGRKPYAGIMIFNSKITATLITQLSDEWTICLELRSSVGKFIMVTSYFQYSHEIGPYIQRFREINQLYANEKVIYTGDINAKSTLWHGRNTDKRGEEMEELISELNLEICNEPGNPPTFKNSTKGESNIDVTLVTQRAYIHIAEWHVGDGLTTSDHNIIFFNINKGSKQQPNNEDIVPKYNLYAINWQKVEEELKVPEITGGCDLNEKVRELTENIQQTISKFSPKPKQKKKYKYKVLESRARNPKKKMQNVSQSLSKNGSGRPQTSSLTII